MITEWNIQSRSQACQECGRAFADQAVYHTILFDARAGLERLDVCEGCWNGQFRDGARDRKGFISQWRGVYLEPPVEPEPIAKETAETLLRKLLERNDPQHSAACYILAVMLERKRLLKVKDEVIQDGERLFIYEQPRTGDAFTIRDPRLQLDQLDQVQRLVAQLLEAGLPPEAPAESEPDTPPKPPPAAAAETLEDSRPATT